MTVSREANMDSLIGKSTTIVEVGAAALDRVMRIGLLRAVCACQCLAVVDASVGGVVDVSWDRGWPTLNRDGSMVSASWLVKMSGVKIWRLDGAAAMSKWTATR